MKKILSLFLAFLMLAVSSSNALALAFPSDSKQKSNQEKINYLKHEGIIEGYENGDLALERPIKRSEITKIIVYSLGKKDAAKLMEQEPALFSDIENHWAKGVIQFAAKNKNAKNDVTMVNGYPDKTFKPEKNISNAEVLKMLVALTKEDLKPEDVAKAQWPFDWIRWALELKIIGDNSGINKSILPNEPATRQDAFVALYNALSRYGKGTSKVPEFVPNVIIPPGDESNGRNTPNPQPNPGKKPGSPEQKIEEEIKREKEPDSLKDIGKKLNESQIVIENLDTSYSLKTQEDAVQAKGKLISGDELKSVRARIIDPSKKEAKEVDVTVNGKNFTLNLKDYAIGSNKVDVYAVTDRNELVRKTFFLEKESKKITVKDSLVVVPKEKGSNQPKDIQMIFSKTKGKYYLGVNQTSDVFKKIQESLKTDAHPIVMVDFGVKQSFKIADKNTIPHRDVKNDNKYNDPIQADKVFYAVTDAKFDELLADKALNISATSNTNAGEIELFIDQEGIQEALAHVDFASNQLVGSPADKLMDAEGQKTESLVEKSNAEDFIQLPPSPKGKETIDVNSLHGGKLQLKGKGFEHEKKLNDTKVSYWGSIHGGMANSIKLKELPKEYWEWAQKAFNWVMGKDVSHEAYSEVALNVAGGTNINNAMDGDSAQTTLNGEIFYNYLAQTLADVKIQHSREGLKLLHAGLAERQQMDMKLNLKFNEKVNFTRFLRSLGQEKSNDFITKKLKQTNNFSKDKYFLGYAKIPLYPGGPVVIEQSQKGSIGEVSDMLALLAAVYINVYGELEVELISESQLTDSSSVNVNVFDKKFENETVYLIQQVQQEKDVHISNRDVGKRFKMIAITKKDLEEKKHKRLEGQLETNADLGAEFSLLLLGTRPVWLDGGLRHKAIYRGHIDIKQSYRNGKEKLNDLDMYGMISHGAWVYMYADFDLAELYQGHHTLLEEQIYELKRETALAADKAEQLDKKIKAIEEYLAKIEAIEERTDFKQTQKSPSIKQIDTLKTRAKDTVLYAKNKTNRTPSKYQATMKKLDVSLDQVKGLYNQLTSSLNELVRLLEQAKTLRRTAAYQKIDQTDKDALKEIETQSRVYAIGNNYGDWSNDEKAAASNKKVNTWIESLESIIQKIQDKQEGEPTPPNPPTPPVPDPDEPKPPNPPAPNPDEPKEPDVVTVGDFRFDRSTGTIVQYIGEKTRVNIPSQIAGVEVRVIGDSAFFPWHTERPELTSVTIPETVEEIQKDAFRQNKLQSIGLPNGLHTIGEDAFALNQLIRVSIPESVIEIGDGAFRQNKLAQAILPDSVERVGDGAFSYNPLRKVKISNRMTVIEKYTFKGNDYSDTKIGELIIPDSVERIESEAFMQSGITKLTLPDYDAETEGKEVAIGTSAFELNDLTELYIPRSIVTIGERAFALNEAMIRLEISNSVTRIGDGAFWRNGLVELKLPSNLEVIEGDAFSNNKLSELTIPNTVTEIGERAFYDNDLRLVRIPDSVAKIGDGAFQLNKRLKSVELPSHTVISEGSWYGSFDEDVIITRR